MRGPWRRPQRGEEEPPPAQTGDGTLVVATQGGDPRAFGLLYDRYQDLVLRCGIPRGAHPSMVEAPLHHGGSGLRRVDELEGRGIDPLDGRQENDVQDRLKARQAQAICRLELGVVDGLDARPHDLRRVGAHIHHERNDGNRLCLP